MGYAVNERIRKEQIGELRQLVGMLGRTIQSQPLLSTDETNALFEVVTNYTYALDTLDKANYNEFYLVLFSLIRTFAAVKVYKTRIVATKEEQETKNLKSL